MKGKSDAHKQLICMMQRAHFQVWVGVFSCQDKYLFRYLWCCGKKNRMWFSVVCTLIDKCSGLTRRNRVSPQQNLRVTDSKYRESLDRFEKSKTLKLCLKNAFREFSSKILFRFSKNLTSSRNSQKTKIHLFTSLNMQKISGKSTKFSVFALQQFTILEHGINLAQKFHLSSI